MFGRRSGKTKALVEKSEEEGVEFYFDIKDMEHCEEIREQLWAVTGKKDCKISWCSNLDVLLNWRDNATKI